MAKQKTKIAPPKNRSDAAGLLAELGTLSSIVSISRADRDLAVAALALKTEQEIAPLLARSDAIRKTLKKWATKGRDALVDDGTKTITLSTGTIYWRMGPEAVETVEDLSDDSVIERLRDAKCQDMVRVTRSLDKENIRKSWDALADLDVDLGLRLVQRESVYLAPALFPEPLEIRSRSVTEVDRLDGKPKEGKSK